MPAFEMLAAARSEHDAQVAYNALLYAVGHHHSGTSYAVMSPATPLLARLVPLFGAGASAGMEVLTDCALWSAGERLFKGPDGRTHQLGQDMKKALQSLEGLAQQSAAMPCDDRRHRAGRGLLEAPADLE